MADLKISELTNLTAADPANDMIPIVDVSATPPASGSTKRISINNILACSPAATLASATITGDLTVDTNSLYVNSSTNNVGLGTLTPSGASGRALEIYGGAGQSRIALKNDTTGSASTDGSQIALVGSQLVIQNREASEITFETNNSERYRLASDGVATWSNVGGGAGTAMTLNSTGLGVGGSPNAKVSCAGFSSANVAPDFQINRSSSGTAIQTGPNLTFADGTANNTVALQNSQGRFGIWNYGAGAWNERLSVDSSGNVGIGVTPSYLLHTAVASGANQNIARFQVTGASNGLTITWNHATTKMIVNFSNLPTSSAGLASGDLWIDTAAGNTLKVA